MTTLGATLLVGATGGLGAPLAIWAAENAKVLICVSRRAPAAGRWIKADLAAEGGVAQVAAELSGARIDALIYAAGSWETDAFTAEYDFANGPEADIDRVMALNVVAPIKLVRALLPNFAQADSPRALFIGALSGRDNLATREVANTASKFGLRGMAQALRREAPALGVTILNVGNVATPEVEDDIQSGRAHAQTPIPISDFISTIAYALSLSPASVVWEIDLAQTAA